MPSTTNPQDWFLNNVEHTDGNLVTPLIDGQAYFSALLARLQNAGSSSFIHISGWRLNPDSEIDPVNNLTVRQQFFDSINNNGLKVRSMLWYFPGTIGDFGFIHGPENEEFTQFVIDNGGEAILDNRLPLGKFASHHQKFSVIGDDTGATAFLGGIDLAPDRWDDTTHSGSNLRDREFYNAWHDIQASIEGPAVEKIWEVFRERWNDPRAPHNFPAVGGTTPTPIDDSERPQTSNTLGSHSVQVLKTYACKSFAGEDEEEFYPFAQLGDFSYRDALIVAIRNAEHFIYLEDQYFWTCRIVDELAEAVERGISVILVLTEKYDVPGLEPYHNYLRGKSINQLLDAQGDQNRVFIYHLLQTETNPGGGSNEEIYVHSKTVIIDDRYMTIGSGNINRRSLTTDSELGIGVVDTQAVTSAINGQSQQVGRLVLDYRKALWTEHLNTNAADDPFDSNGRPNGFPTDNTSIGHIHRHAVGDPKFCFPSVVPFGLLNVSTIC